MLKDYLYTSIFPFNCYLCLGTLQLRVDASGEAIRSLAALKMTEDTICDFSLSGKFHGLSHHASIRFSGPSSLDLVLQFSVGYSV